MKEVYQNQFSSSNKDDQPPRTESQQEFEIDVMNSYAGDDNEADSDATLTTQVKDSCDPLKLPICFKGGQVKA